MSKENKMPFGKVVIRTLKCCLSLADQWKVWLSYAFVMGLISLFFRRWSYGCMVENDSFWCSADTVKITTGFILETVIYYILLIAAIFAYIYDYYQAAFLKHEFKIKDLFVFKRAKIKAMIFLAAIFIEFLLFGGVSYFLLKKSANPNWMIEFIYFLIVFASFLIPLLTIRTAAFVSYYLQDIKMPSLVKIYKDTAGCSLNPLVLFFLALVSGIILLIQSNMYLRALNYKFNNLAVAFFSEVAGFVIILICYSLIIAVFRAQHEILSTSSVSRETVMPAEREPYNPAPKARKAQKSNKKQDLAPAKATKKVAKKPKKATN